MGYMILLHISTLIPEILILISSASLFLSRGDYFSWELVSQVTQLGTVSDAIVLPIPQVIITVVIFVAYILLAIFIKKSKISLESFYKKITLLALAGTFVFASIGNILTHVIVKNKYSEESYFTSDAFAYESFLSTRTSLQKFGYYGYYFESLCRKMFPSLEPELNNLGTAYSHNEYTSILNGLCEDNNVIMICAESFDNFGISKELTPILYSLKKGADLSTSGILNYYNVTKENGETNISRKDFDYNEETNTYTFNNTDIYSDVTFDEVGLELTKHFAREMTRRSELESLTGITQGKINSYEYSIPSILSDDYSTNYLHTNWGSYYERNQYITSELGFENAKFYEDMKDFATSSEDLLNCFTLDSEIIKHYVDNQSEFNCFPTNEKFFTYFMTITTHGFFKNSSLLNKNYALLDAISNSPICDETISLYNNLSETLKTSVKNYLARVIDTEYTLAYIVNYLYENNILDNTIICFAADHIPYTNNIEEFKYSYLKDVLNVNPESYMHLAEGFIYSTKIKNDYLKNNGEDRKINHLTSNSDLAPTLLSLLGKNYDQKQYLGTTVINKLVSDPENSCYNKVYRSYYYGGVESENLLSYDGQLIVSKNPDYKPSQKELDEFKKNYNDIFAKYYSVLEQRNNQK